MPIKGPEWDYFGGTDGVIVETIHGKSKYFWECMFCQVRLGGKVFPNRRARIHLSGDPTLRNGIVSRVCTAAPIDVKARFTALVIEKRTTKAANDSKRKRAEEVLRSKRIAMGDTTYGPPQIRTFI